jgi:uncharacterized membrane protein YvlD (DUF360 family)
VRPPLVNHYGIGAWAVLRLRAELGNWRLLLVRTLTSGVTVVATVFLVPGLSFQHWRYGEFVLVGLVFGLLTALVKPLLQFLALRYLVVSYGLVLVLINAGLLWLLSLLLGNLIHAHSLLAGVRPRGEDLRRQWDAPRGAGCRQGREAALRAAIKMLLIDGFFHADPHPGNLFVNTDTGVVTFLDCGMVGELTVAQRAHMVVALVFRQHGPHFLARIAEVAFVASLGVAAVLVIGYLGQMLRRRHKE